MLPFLWLNGQLISGSAARISPLDLGFASGYGLFETLLARSGHLMEAEAHHQRLQKGCESLRLPQLGWDTFIAACEQVLASNQLCQADARVRVMVTAGEGSWNQPPDSWTSTQLVTAQPISAQPACVRVCHSSWALHSQAPTAGLKTTSYLPSIRAMQEARQRGFDEALLFNERGELAEGSWSNVFALLDGQLVTPPLNSGCLPGITRARVIHLAQTAGLPCLEKPLSAADLEQASEIFLTSSLRGILPVLAHESRQLDAPGPCALNLQSLYTTWERDHLKLRL
jgi:branched-chain amino acid aminotransferase